MHFWCRSLSISYFVQVLKNLYPLLSRKEKSQMSNQIISLLTEFRMSKLADNVKNCQSYFFGQKSRYARISWISSVHFSNHIVHLYQHKTDWNFSDKNVTWMLRHRDRYKISTWRTMQMIFSLKSNSVLHITGTPSVF